MLHNICLVNMKGCAHFPMFPLFDLSGNKGSWVTLVEWLGTAGEHGEMNFCQGSMVRSVSFSSWIVAVEI